MSTLILSPQEADADADPLEWRHSATISVLVETLETWLDARAPWPRKASEPEVRLISQSSADARSSPRFAGTGPTRGLYDAETDTIYLVRPWDRRDPVDVSILLHEIVHHRQDGAQHWVCPEAQELSAYRLQDAWLAELGLQADVNWIAIVLASGCSPHDIHPD
ncbi:DUF6647 family protein [Salipiger mangrovisoli]|uniref:DUF6647 domain-containing protein n=1 Tax=Salipiger mangrovisoli TaxID=2865933 RepID=A0ABR9XBH0_9RHOB|nr:DUF6647 family protein [Salipiger mangrovisoli]MBE9640984.1 hypothetical protein [Salipiger mangrovisoli]